MSLERDLKQAFERHAGDVHPSTDPLGEATTRLQHSRRRRAAGYVVGAVAIAAALGVMLPKLIGTRPAQIIHPGPKPTLSSNLVPVSGPVQDIQLVSPGHGWVIQNGTMYYTSDGGRSWVTAAEPGPGGQAVVAAFANSTTAWAVIREPQNDPKTEGRLAIERTPLPSPCLTSAGGCNTTDVKTSVPPSVGFGPVSIWFVGQDRGWLLVDLGGGSGVAHGSQLFATTDGGKSWHVLPGSPQLVPAGDSHMMFVTSSVGFITDSVHLYRTVDGGRTWQDEPYDHPSNCPSPSVGLPRFFSDKDGATLVSLTSGSCNTAFVDTTSDGGATWRLDPYVLPQLGVPAWSAPTSDFWFFALEGHIYQAQANATVAHIPTNLTFLKLDFVDALNGWASVLRGGCSGDLRDCTDVYQTSDGGRSWLSVLVEVQPVTPHCTPSRLTASATEQDAIVSAQFGISLRNTLDSVCLFGEVPDNIQFLDGNGQPLPVRYVPPSGPVIQKPSILVAPHGNTVVIFSWVNYCGTPPHTLVIRLALADGDGVISIPFTPTLIPRCDHSGSPSTLTLDTNFPIPPTGGPPASR